MMGTPKEILVLITMVSLGCRPDPGDPHYEDYSYPSEDAGDGVLPGPDPFQEGENRLTLGVFYEGGYSHSLAINDGTWHYYIYLNEGAEGNPQTYNQVSDTDRVEGLLSDRIVHAGYGWWGGGVHLDSPVSLSDWSTLYISLKSSDNAFSEVNLSVGSSGVLTTLRASTYGYANDGQWHDLAISLSDFEDAGAVLDSIDTPFAFGGTTPGLEGEILKIDNVYLTQDILGD